MNCGCGGRRENVDGSRRSMRVRLFHVNNAFIFRRFQFWKMRMEYRSPTRMRVHMKKRGVNRRENERDDRTECGYLRHSRILLNRWFKVNGSDSEFLFRRRNYRDVSYGIERLPSSERRGKARLNTCHTRS